MPPTISMRIDEQTRDHIDDAAAARGTTASDLLRDAVYEHLGLAERTDRNDTPISLSHYQRTSLALQHKILAKLDTEDPDYHLECAEILEKGYTLEYWRAFSPYPEMPERDCRLVMDILDMFRMIESCLNQYGPEATKEIGEFADLRLRFRGFDGNDSREGAMIGYVDHLIATERWQEFEERVRKNRGNSHSPMLDTYQRMLDVYTPIFKTKSTSHWTGDKPPFSLDELKQVNDSCVHPANR